MILCVNVKLNALRDAHIAGKHYLWVCLGGCFVTRLTFESVDLVKITLTNVGGHHPIYLGPE